MKRALLLFILFASFFYGRSQSASTRGTEFWMTFMYNLNAATPALSLHFSALQNSVVTVENPYASYSTTVNVSANSLASLSLSIVFSQPYNGNTSGTIANRVLKITATTEITVYALNYYTASTDGSVILPVQALGLNYRVLSYKGLNATTPSEFCVVATKDTTVVKIIPTCNTKDNKPKNVPYYVTLNKWQCYQVQAKTDSSLTGSIVEVQNCKPVAVFGGSVCSNVPVGCGYCDHLYEQLYPFNMWGKEFILVPTATRSKDRYIVLADQSNTVLDIDGTSTTITAAGGTYEADVTAPTYISASKPVSIALYAVGQQCGGGNGDPMMMWVTPVEQNINSIIFVAQNSSAINNHYVNIIARTGSVGSIKLNGSNIGSSFATVTSNTAYSYVKKNVSSGANAITSDSGFTAYAYGYGNVESYGYNVGSSILDLNRFFTVNGVTNDNFSTPTTSLKICKNASVAFRGYSGSYTPISWLWKFGNDTSWSQNVNKTFTDTGIVKVLMITSWVGTNLCYDNDTTLDTAIQYIHIIDPKINILNADTIVCRGSSFYPRVDLSGDTVVSWNPVQDISCNKCTTPLITPSASGWYKGSMGGGSMGCMVTDSFFVHVKDSVKIYGLKDTIICKGQKAIVKATLLNKDSIIQYTYDLYANNVFVRQDTANTFDVFPDTTTTYIIKVNNSCYQQSSQPVKVYVRPPLKVQYTDSFLICRNQNSSFTFKASGGDSSYMAYLVRNNSIVDSIQNALVNVSYSFLFTPDPGSSYRLILKDGCTVLNDSPVVHFIYRSPLSFSHTPDTLVCKQQTHHLYVRPMGGDSTYTFYLLINNFLVDSIANAAINNLYYFTVAPVNNTTYKIVLRDGCTIINDTQAITVSVRNPLSFTVSNDSNICEGHLTSIFIKPEGGDSSYTIYLLDSTAKVDSISGAVQGSTYHFDVYPTFLTQYKIVLKDGCTLKNDTHSVIYTFRSPLTFTHTPDTILCIGQTIPIYVKPFGGDSTYAFYLLKNNIVIDSLNASLAIRQTFMVAPVVSTIYTIVLSDGCTYLNDTQMIYVVVRNPLALNISNINMICRGQNLAIAVTPSGGDSTYALYMLNNGVIIDSVKNAVNNTAYNFNKVPALNANYSFVLKDGCTLLNDTQKVNFSFRDALSFTVSNDATICIGQTYPITVTPYGGDSTYTFYLLNNNIIIDSIVNATIANNYFFTVAPVTNSIYKVLLKDDCTIQNDSHTVIVNVHTPLSFSFSNDVFICEGSLTDIRVIGSGGDSTYTFYLLDSTTVVDSVRNALPNQLYRFYVHPTFLTHFKVVLSDNCTIKNDTQNVIYIFRPPIGFTHTPDTMICTGQTIALHIKPYGGDSTYNFYLLENNTVTDSVKNARMFVPYAFYVTPSATTKYTIVLSDECTYLNDTQTINVTLRDPLSIAVVNDSVICRGQHLLIKATPNGGDSTYALYLLSNNIIIDSVKNAVSNTAYIFDELPSLTDNYSFILKDYCTSSDDTADVTFAFRGPITFSHSSDPVICIGQSTNLRVTPYGGDSTYTIYLMKNSVAVDSITNAIINNNYYFTVSPVVTTSYAVKITDGCTILTDTQAIRVFVRDPLKVVISPDTIICKGQTATIHVLPTGGDSSYTIYLIRTQNGSLIDSITQASANVTYNFFVSPIIKTSYAIALEDGCTILQANGLVTVDVYPPLVVKAFISKSKICYGDSIILTAVASGGAINSVYTYLWSPGGGTSPMAKINPPSSAWYSIKADDGCSTSALDSVYIEVEPNPIADFLAANTSGCEPFTTTFSNTTTTFSNVHYLWKFGDGSSDTSATPPAHTFVKPGSYDVKLYVTSVFGCIDSMVKKNYITVHPNPQITLKIDPRKVKVNNGKITFISGLKFTDDFDFDFGDGKSNLAQLSSNNIFGHIYTDTGYFTVKLSARNTFGCTGELTDTLFIEDYYTVFIPNVFSPNNKDGINDYFKPVSTFSKHYEMKIYDRWGQIIYSETCNDRSYNCKGWDGTYNGKPVLEDTYIYTITLIEEDHNKYYERGTVMVLR